MVNERIKKYIIEHKIEVSEEQRENILNSVLCWFNYTINDAISDSVKGVLYEENI